MTASPKSALLALHAPQRARNLTLETGLTDEIKPHNLTVKKDSVKSAFFPQDKTGSHFSKRESKESIKQ